jgi:hypothetical protein
MAAREHGTTRGYWQHVYRGDQRCRPCLDAAAASERNERTAKAARRELKAVTPGFRLACPQCAHWFYGRSVRRVYCSVRCRTQAYAARQRVLREHGEEQA